jgi:ABC-type Fe3+/spermidine/putrescine transport system ATPase subunit
VILELDDVSHRYGGRPAVDTVSVGVEAGELVALLGPSGCGKTTLVQAIAGHVRPTGGRIRLRGRDVTDDPPESRRVGLVFQEPTLYPHMTVAENVAYGVAAREGVEDPDAVVTAYLDLVALADRRGAYPRSLSGGQRRRAELARALAPEPDLLLLDEPLSALDRSLRTQLREAIARIHRETGVATLFVTHDQRDAMAVADRLVVMADGHVAAVGTPRELYASPPTPFVASFLGRSTAVSGTFLRTEPTRVAVAGSELRLDRSTSEFGPGESVTCHLRPRALEFREEGDPARSLAGEVTAVVDAGRHYDVSVRIAPDEELLVECRSAPPTVGESVTVELPADGVTLFGPDFEVSPAATPEPVERSGERTDPEG